MAKRMPIAAEPPKTNISPSSPCIISVLLNSLVIKRLQPFLSTLCVEPNGKEDGNNCCTTKYDEYSFKVPHITSSLIYN